VWNSGILRARTSKYQNAEEILRVWELLEKIMFQHLPAENAKIKKGKIRELCFERFWRDSKLSELGFPSLALPCLVLSCLALHCITFARLVWFRFVFTPIQSNSIQTRPSQVKSSQAKPNQITSIFFLFFSFLSIIFSNHQNKFSPFVHVRQIFVIISIQDD
jgi:hypothetical protein